MQALTDVKPSELIQEPAGIELATVVKQPFPQMEAAVINELDRVTRLADRDPLAALEQMLRLMQGLDVEILKCMAPALVETAQHDAAVFAAGKDKTSTKGRQMTTMLKLQESIGKLGMARVRVRDEQDRRSGRNPLLNA